MGHGILSILHVAENPSSKQSQSATATTEGHLISISHCSPIQPGWHLQEPSGLQAEVAEPKKP